MVLLALLLAASVVGARVAQPGLVASAAIQSPNKLLGWGQNAMGQLGTGCQVFVTCGGVSVTPVQAVGLPSDDPVQTIAAGWDHSLGLTKTGQVWDWGRNTFGQLGNGTETSTGTPQHVGLTGPATSVAGGFGHSLAATGSGEVWAWGNNSWGQLGNGCAVGESCESSLTPVQVSGLPTAPDDPVVQVAAGAEHSLALTRSGEVWAWGDNFFGQLGNGCVVGESCASSSTPVRVEDLPPAPSDPVVQVAAGAYHSLARTKSGEVWAWGVNFDGQLGNGTETPTGTPHHVGLTEPATSVAGGSDHSLAATESGEVWAWGGNRDGQLGDGSTESSAVPVRVQGLAGTVTTVAAGASHSLALAPSGQVWAWGANQLGQLGNGCVPGRACEHSSTPILVPIGSGTGIAGGASHSLAIAGNKVLGWGLDVYGQLGSGCEGIGCGGASNTPVQGRGLPSDDPLRMIAAGWYHSLALTESGQVWSWGLNDFGQLGNGTDTPTGTPQHVTLPDPAVSIAGGYGHSLAATASGEVWAWGYNVFGQLGNGCVLGETCEQSSTPIRVEGLPLDDPVVEVAGGGSHSLALTRSGHVWAWGNNHFGQLGDGCVFPQTCEFSSTSTPHQVQGLPLDDAVVDIAAGADHSLAVTQSGQVWAWGDNTDGQLGDGNRTSTGTPQRTALSERVTSVAGGSFHSLAVTAGGDVWAWGDNFFGQLGNGCQSGERCSTPVQVEDLPGPVAKVAAGGGHSLALTGSGQVWAWGENFFGQLGNGTTIAFSSTAVEVPVPPNDPVTAIAAGDIHSLAINQPATPTPTPPIPTPTAFPSTPGLPNTGVDARHAGP